MKTYLVQTWGEHGGRENHYEVLIENDQQLNDLRKFLGKKPGHVLITREPDRKIPGWSTTESSELGVLAAHKDAKPKPKPKR